MAFTKPLDTMTRAELLKLASEMSQRTKRLEEMLNAMEEACSNLSSTWEVVKHHLETGLDG